MTSARLKNSTSSEKIECVPITISMFPQYKPMRFFCLVGSIPFIIGVIAGIRFLIFYACGSGDGHVQSLILAAVLLMIGWQTFMMGIQADIMSANRKLIQDVQLRVKKI